LGKAGVAFTPFEDEGKELVEVSTYDIDLLRTHFTKLYEGVLSLNIPLKLIKIRRDSCCLLIYLRD